MASKSYSQFQAFKALTLAALRSIRKSPSAVVFTIAFPLVFILVFGYVGGNQPNATKVGLLFANKNDWQNLLGNQSDFEALFYKDTLELHNALKGGKVDLLLESEQNNHGSEIEITSLKLGLEKAAGLQAAISYQVLLQDSVAVQNLEEKITFQQKIQAGKPYQTIDFILPGQLGFSLLASSIFGTAFVFFNLRQGLVLKRFFASPIRKPIILLSEGVARMIFQLLGALLLIGIGYFFLKFTLIHGWITLLTMLFICAIGLLVFMSIGFIISGIAGSESTIPPLSNIFTLPQFLLAGTFFPIESFPAWLQPISRALPLTYLNDALREVAFHGASLWEVKFQLLILIAWGILGYFVASRTFKWE